MSQFSGIIRATRQAVLDHLLKTSTWTAPTNVYVALFTVAPTEVGGGTECTGSAYARVKHNNWVAATAASPSVAVNDGDITFPEAGGSWGAIVAFGLFNQDSPGGTLLAVGKCSKTISSGDTAIFLDGTLEVTLDGTVS